MTNLSINAIRSCTTAAEAKAILADRRLTVLTLTATYGADHPTTKLFDADYWAMVDEYADLVNAGVIAR